MAKDTKVEAFSLDEDDHYTYETDMVSYEGEPNIFRCKMVNKHTGISKVGLALTPEKAAEIATGLHKEVWRCLGNT